MPSSHTLIAIASGLGGLSLAVLLIAILVWHCEG